MAASAGRDAATQVQVVAFYQAKAAQIASGDGDLNRETFIRERYMIYEQLFTVEGVEAAIKKLDMKLGHVNPLDS
eukprot:2248646-Lingulodinium_polyedra.AAC.1